MGQGWPSRSHSLTDGGIRKLLGPCSLRSAFDNYLLAIATAVGLR